MLATTTLPRAPTVSRDGAGRVPRQLRGTSPHPPSSARLLRPSRVRLHVESEGFGAVRPSQPAVDGGRTRRPPARVHVRVGAGVLIWAAGVLIWAGSQAGVKVRAEGDGVESTPREGAGGFRRRPVADRMSAWSAQTEDFMPSRKLPALTSADTQDSGYAQATTPRHLPAA